MWLGSTLFYVSILPAFLVIAASTQSVFALYFLIPISIYPLLDFISLLRHIKQEKKHYKRVRALSIIMFIEALAFIELPGRFHDVAGLFILIFIPTAFISFLIINNEKYISDLKELILNKNMYNLVFCKTCGETYNNTSISICQQCKNSQLFIGSQLDYKTMLLSFYLYKYGFYIGAPLLGLSIILQNQYLQALAIPIIAVAVISLLRNRGKYQIYGLHTPKI